MIREKSVSPKRTSLRLLEPGIAWTLDCEVEAIVEGNPLEERIQVYSHGVAVDNIFKNSDIYKQILNYLKVDDYLVR